MPLTTRIRRIFGIRSGERARVAWMAVYSLFIGVFCAFFLTAANALFLDLFEISFLPLAYIAAAIVGYVAVMVFSRLERSVPVRWLFTINLAFLLALSAAFWYLAQHTGNPWVVFAMFVCVGPMFSLIFLGYWGLAARLFDLREGKRLFGLIGAGEEVSTIIGLFSIPFLMRLLAAPEELLIFATIGLAGCLVTVVLIGRRFSEQLSASAEPGEPQAKKKADAGVTRLIKSPYFLLMAGLVILLSVAHYIVDFGFLSQIRVRFDGPEQIAQFLGIFFGVTKILELGMKLFVSGRLVSTFGLRVGLMVLPVVLLLVAGLAVVIATFGMAAAQFFLLVALAKLLWVVARTSTFLPSFRVLYQPVPPADRLAYQTHVDGTAKQLAIAVVGVALLLFSTSEGFNALTLFYALIPVLLLWIAAVFAVYNRYRDRLMTNLTEEMARATNVSPVETLIERLLEAPPDQLESSAALLARVDATSIVPMLTRMVEEGSPAARIAALRYIEQLKALGGVGAVERSAASDPDSEVREVAARTLKTLREVVELTEDPDRVRELAASPVPAQRDLAVSAVGFSSNPEVHIGLTDLLWDNDRDVRRAALVAAGRVGSSSYWHRLVSQLFEPKFANAATFGVITIGDPILSDLEKAFNRGDQHLQARILRIYERIGTPAAQQLLLNRIGYPDRDLRRKALLSLTGSGYRAEHEQASMVVNEIEAVVKNTAWKMACLLDMGDDQVLSELREALEIEIENGRDAVFLLLSLLYDPQAIRLVKANLEGGSPEATVYALEIMDLLISPELKPLVFPILEDLNYNIALRRLDPYFARHRFDRVDRLSSIINAGFDSVGLWTRARAVKAIAGDAGEVVPDLVSCLFHPIPIMHEVAARCILELDPDGYRGFLAKLPLETRRNIDQVIGPEGDLENWDSRSVLGRARWLREIPVFSALRWEAMTSIAQASEEKILREGQSLPSQKDPMGSVYTIADGRLEFSDAAVLQARGALVAQDIFAFGPGASPVVAAEVSHLIRIDPAPLFELAIDEPDLVPVLLRAGQQLAQEEVRQEAPSALDGAWSETQELGMSV